MTIDSKDNYQLIRTEVKDFDNFITLFRKNYENIKDSHIILDISHENNFTEQNILVFLEYADLQRENGMSFVVITTKVDVDHFPERFNIVPTLVEAEDVIEMEDIQRDLGF